MSSSLRRPCLMAILVPACFVLTLAGADAPPVKAPAKPADGKPVDGKPPVIIVDDVKDLLQQLKNELPPDKFKELLDQAEKEAKRRAPEKPELYGNVRLSGKVEGELAHLRVQYDFKTYQPREMVPLGCQKGWPTAATLDDGKKLPLLQGTGDEGYLVQIEQPGTYRLTLEVEAAVTARGGKGDRGFELGLPKVPLTLLDFLDLPPGVRDLRVVGRSFTPADLSSKNDKRKLIGLGGIDKLDVNWRSPTATPQVETLLASQGKIEVVIDETHVITDAELTLQVLRGQNALWRILIPPLPQTTVEIEAATGDERAPTIERPADAKNPVWQVRLKEPSADPVTIRIRNYQPRTPGKAAPIGPFVVLGAVQQRGVMKITAPPNVRVRSRWRGDVTQRDVSDEQRKANTVALFTYGNLPVPVKEATLPLAPLEIETETIKGVVESTTHHTLKLTPEGWLVATEIDVKAERDPVDRLEVELPADFEVKAGPTPLVEQQDVETRDVGGKRIGIIRLSGKRTGAFKVTLTGVWPLPDDPKAGVVSLPLPRPFGTIDRGGGTLRFAVSDDKELLIARESGLQTLPPGKRSHSFAAERAPTRVEVAWREYRPEMPVKMFVDLTLGDREARVRQQMKCDFPIDTARPIMLRCADALDGRTPLADRAVLTPQGPGTWSASLKDPQVTLEYTFRPTRDKAGVFAVPLIWPEGVTHCETRVRVWSEPGTQPVLDGAQWDKLPLEVVADRDSLPAMVLRAAGLNVPLRLTEQTVAALPTLAVDRALIQAAVSDGNQQAYRARFLISKMSAHSFDVELPATPAGINLEMFLDGKRVTNLRPVDEEGNPVEGGRIVRIRVEPELYRGPVVLDIRYQITPGRGDHGILETRLQPPRLRGNVFPGRVRWQVGMPADWVSIWAGGSFALEQRWGFRAWLPAPRSAVNAADLERWFNANADSPGTAEAGLGLGSRSSELVGWQANLGPLTVVRVSERTWLLACSLVLLLLGLGMYLLSVQPRLFGAAVIVLAVAVVTIGIAWPTVLPVILFGIQPGVLVLLLVGGFLWLRQSRYHRQRTIMPGFSRLAPGSSVMRAGSSHRPRGEPSTVDAHGMALDIAGSRPGKGPDSRTDKGPASKADKGPASKADKGSPSKADKGPASKPDVGSGSRAELSSGSRQEPVPREP